MLALPCLRWPRIDGRCFSGWGKEGGGVMLLLFCSEWIKVGGRVGLGMVGCVKRRLDGCIGWWVDEL